MTKMAFEINDLIRILILVLFAIPMIASMNINCSGRAFHCVNSTHFMICVDLGGGLSTTIDDFVIPCPATTVCHPNNIFECDFPEVVTMPPLNVVGVYKQSDTSDSTTVTNSVTPISDIFSVLEENITATTLPTPEHVTPIVKFEVLENIKDLTGSNSDNTTETSLKVNSSFIDSTNEIVNGKQASNLAIITSATDKNKNLEPVVETSIQKIVNTSLTDTPISNDTVTSVIGLINLISTDPPIVVTTKPPTDILTSLDSTFDSIATTTEQYVTKEVPIYGDKVENVTDKINLPTDIIFHEGSVIPHVFSDIYLVNTDNENNIINAIDNINKTDIINQNITKPNNFSESNITTELVPTTEYLFTGKNVTTSESVTVDLSPQTTTDTTFVPLGLADLISADHKPTVPFNKDNNVLTTTNEYDTKHIPATVINTTPKVNIAVENVLKSDINNNSFTESYSTGEITTIEHVPETNINYSISKPMTVASSQSTTEKTFFAITTESNIINITETSTIFETVSNNDSLVENKTIVTQPLEIITATESIVVTDNLYQINEELNQTLITTKNTTVDIINTTEKENTVFNDSSIHTLTEVKSAGPTLISSTTTANLPNVILSHALEVTNESVLNVKNSVNETYLENTTEINTEPTLSPSTTIKYSLSEITAADTLLSEFKTHKTETKIELPTTNGPLRFNEPNLKKVGTGALLNVYTTQVTVTADSVTNRTVKDLMPQSDFVINPPTDRSIKQTTVADTEIKTPGFQPNNLGTISVQVNLNADQWTTTDQDVGQTTAYLNTVENSVTAKITSTVSENSSPTDIVNTTDTDVVNAQHVVLSQAPDTANQVDELVSTTPITVENTLRIIDATTIPEEVSTNTPLIVDVYRTTTTDYKIETSTTLPVDITHTVTMGTDPDIAVTTVPPQETSSQIITTVKLSTTSAPTVFDLVSPTVTTAGYDVNNITDLNTSSWKDSVSIGVVSTKVDSSADVNKTETVIPINGKNNDSATSPGIKSNTDDSIKIVSVLDVVNSAGNALPSVTMQPSRLNSSLSNDYVKTTTSQDLSVYVTATDNVSNYHLVHVESSSQKNPEATVLLGETKIVNSVSPTISILTIGEISTEKVKYVVTETPTPSKVDYKHINSTNTIGNYETEKLNDSFLTEPIPSQRNELPNVAETSTSSVWSVTPSTTVTTDGFTTVPVNDEVTTVKESTNIKSSTQMPLEVVTDSNKKLRTESLLLTLKLSQNVETQTAQYYAESSSPMLEPPTAQITTESTHTTILTESTPLVTAGLMNQDILTGIETTVLPQYVIPSLPIEKVSAADFTPETTHSTVFVQMNQNGAEIKSTGLPHSTVTTVNNNNPQTMASLPRADVTPTQILTELTISFTDTPTTPSTIIDQINQNLVSELNSTDLPQSEISTANNNNPQPMPSLAVVGVTVAQTTPIAAAGEPNQDVITEIKPTELPQYVKSTVGNNIRQTMPSLSIGVSATQITSEPSTHTTNKLTHDDIPEIKPTDLPLSVTTVTNSSPYPMASLPTTGVTATQITTEPTHAADVFLQTPPLLAAVDKTSQDGLSGLITTDLSQYITTTGIYTNLPSTSYKATESINTDSPTSPDSMVETINVNGDKISGSFVGDAISSGGTFSNPTVIATSSFKPVKNIIDHESIVIGSTSKITKSVDINRAEIVNHTESNLMPSDVNIDSIKIKETSIEEIDSKSSLLKSGTSVQNKTLASEFSIKSKIELNDGTPVNKIEYSFTTGTKKLNGSESDPQNNATQPKTKITKDNKKTDSSPIANIEIIGDKIYHIPVDTKNISDSNNISNAQANTTTSDYGLSQQNSTINDELEQHLVSTNHTITAEVQSHLNESDKQSNKTTFNGTSMLNSNLTSIKSNVSSKNTSVITVPASVFNCTNHTRGKYADKKDCRKFYTCIGNLQAILGTCPNNTVFSEINKQCTRNLSHCVRNNQFRCLFEGRFSDFFKDNIYYICVKNRIHGFIRYKLQCQTDYHLNKDSVKCEKNEPISVQSVSSVSETTNDESKPQTKSEKIVSTDDFECEKEGKFPYAKDCSKYYLCTKVKDVYRQKIKKCASEEVFDKNKKKCVESDSGEC